MIRRVSIKHNNMQSPFDNGETTNSEKENNGIDDDAGEENENIDEEENEESNDISSKADLKKDLKNGIKEEKIEQKRGPDNQTLLRLLEQVIFIFKSFLWFFTSFFVNVHFFSISLILTFFWGEQLHSMFRCARIQGLDTSEGLLLFGREHYYVVDGFTLLKTREIRDLDFLPPE